MGCGSGSKEWADFLNHWIENFIQTEEYRKIYTVYFKNPYTSGWFRREFNTILMAEYLNTTASLNDAAAKQAWTGGSLRRLCITNPGSIPIRNHSLELWD